MGQIIAATFFQTTPTAPGAVAVVSSGVGAKITRISVRAELTSSVNSLTTGTSLTSPIMAGIQAIPHGNTPLSLPGDINNSSWLLVEALNLGDICPTWAPSSDTGVYAPCAGLALDWYGQQPYFGNTDFWFSTGAQAGSSPTFQIAGTISVYFGSVA